jgi:hypothetical protein
LIQWIRDCVASGLSLIGQLDWPPTRPAHLDYNLPGTLLCRTIGKTDSPAENG